MIRVSIVLPAFNEAANVEAAVAQAQRSAERMFEQHEVVVVDDGSSDGTGDIVRALGERDPRVRLIRHERNRGYGEALRSGFSAARLDHVFFTDADLQFDMDELERFLPYAGTVDVIAGFRRKRRDPLARKAMGYGWNFLVRVLFYVPVRDIDCAFKLFDRRVLEAVEFESGGAMVNTELMVKLGRSGCSVVEVGVTHHPRRAGHAHGADLRVVWRAFRELLKLRARLMALEAPIR